MNTFTSRELDTIKLMHTLPEDLQRKILHYHKSFWIYNWWDSWIVILGPAVLTPRHYSFLAHRFSWREILEQFVQECKNNRKRGMNEVQVLSRIAFLWNLNFIWLALSDDQVEKAKRHFESYRNINNEFNVIMCFGRQLVIQYRGTEISPNLHNIRKMLALPNNRDLTEQYVSDYFY
jgi:hypothetical protein